MKCDTEWYALYTRHQHEKAVARILASKGFETFLPLCSETRRWQDRSKQLSLPLFPTYMFVLLRGVLERRLEIVTIPGVHAIVASAGRPVPIPFEEMNALRQAIHKAQLEPHPFLKCGDRGRVKSGPLAGIEGIMVRTKNSFRLVLSIETLGRSAAVVVDAFNVERMSAGSSHLVSTHGATHSWGGVTA